MDNPLIKAYSESGIGRSVKEALEDAKRPSEVAAAAASKPARAAVWARSHPVKAALAALPLAVLSLTALGAASPQTAHAIAPIVWAGAAIVASVAGISLAGDGVNDNLCTSLRNFINFMLDTSASFVQGIINGDVLTQNFTALFDSVYPIVYNVHQVAVVPLAKVVLVCFFLVSMYKMFSQLATADAGADLFNITISFVFLAFGVAVIDASFEIMVFIYEAVRTLAANVLDAGTGAMAFTYMPISEDVNDLGALLFMALVTLIAFVVIVGVCTLAQCAVIVRAVQIYAMTCFSPIFLAPLVSDSSRPMATGFLKKYMGVCLAGAILALLFVMLGVVVGSLTVSNADPSTVEGVVQWCCQTLFSLVTLIAFGWCIFKSGGWARDWIGA